ncbi:MAG: acetate kinase [Bacteroidales bacterium]|jgi:acetate kinase|nr:acetate kinase [Bacteroidales bacterium]NLM93282.1 acetate kinase [Bacteroidales bacterium]
MKILVLNCGSSSIKYQFINMANNAELLAKGLLDRIGLKDSELKHQPKGKETYMVIQDVPDHEVGINLILKALLDPDHGVIETVEDIFAVGHRVAHGGENFSASALITEEVMKNIEEVIELAPLHNPANLKGIVSMKKLLPQVPMVAVFDTAFHQTIPQHAYMYGLPYELYEEDKIRRYGFHGTSHKYVFQRACDALFMRQDNVRAITCHLGNGASIAAIKNGKSVDTSMGLTPVEGLMMGTRSGDLDLGALLYIMKKKGLNVEEANNLINKKSGVLGISGISYDMRDIENAAFNEDHKRSQLALEMYYYRIKKYIGAYAAAMGGVDLIVFTGGVGENGPETREAVCKGLEFLGVQFDPERNTGIRGKLELISRHDSPVKVMVVPTNEELVIAHDTLKIVAFKDNHKNQEI